MHNLVVSLKKLYKKYPSLIMDLIFFALVFAAWKNDKLQELEIGVTLVIMLVYLLVIFLKRRDL